MSNTQDKMKTIEETVTTTMEMLQQELEAITGNKLVLKMAVRNVPHPLFSEKAVVHNGIYKTESISEDIICYSAHLKGGKNG